MTTEFRDLFDGSPAISFTPLPGFKAPRPDPALFLSAAHRQQEASREASALLEHLPDTPGLVTLLIQQQFAVDGNRAGLQCLAADGLSNTFVSLGNAAVFVHQNPDWILPTDQKCWVIELPDTAAELFNKLKALDLQSFLKRHWDTYWDARAPRTPVSRRQRLTQLYHRHFEACAQLAYAEGRLSAAQLKPLLAANEDPQEAIKLDEQQLYVEQLSLVSVDRRREALPGALVITVDQEPRTAQLLYLPCQPSALEVFGERTEMEQWLIRQQQTLLPHLDSPDLFSVDYSLAQPPVATAATQLLADLQRRWLDTVSKSAGDDLLEHARLGLERARRASEQLRNQSTLSVATNALPGFAIEPDTLENEPGLFGLLQADIALATRWATLKQARDLLEKYLAGSDGDPQVERFKGYQDRLLAAEKASGKAARALFFEDPGLDSASHYAALSAARTEGLRAEADIQLALGQINADEHQMLTAVLATPALVERSTDIRVSRLSLSLIENNGESQTTTTEELKGALVFSRTITPHTAQLKGGLLLYWPGTQGGIQHFASRQTLEQTCFNIAPDDPLSSLQIIHLDVDPFEYSLRSQHDAFTTQASQLRQRFPQASQAKALASELEQLRTRAMAQCAVHTHSARELAYAQLREQQRTQALARQMPDWLNQLSETERLPLKTMMRDYLEAAKRSHEMLERHLPHRDDVCDTLIDARLRSRFSLKGSVQVKIDLPDSIEWRRELGAPGPGGTPQTNVPYPGAKRSTLTLRDLLLRNIDHDMQQRLAFRKLIVSADDAADASALEAGLDLNYLRTLATELDLAQHYENLILRAFKGAPGQPAFIHAHRQECLREYARLTLKLQGESARLQKRLHGAGPQVFDIVIDAGTSQAWQVDGKHIELLPVRLSAVGKDAETGDVPLLGVTFIVEKISGLTLLYLPDRSDELALSQYPSLESARMALFNLCLSSAMVDYLAGRAARGQYERHVYHLKQALLNNYNAIISTGDAWPSTTSLADHLLNTHMGRLILANRSDARSNATLAMELYALKAGMVFTYLKMALGLVPFVGTAIGLYDAWNSANLAVAAFLRGKVGHGLAELESALLSLFDAMVDVLTGAAPSARALQRTRLRQISGLAHSAGALQAPSQANARRAVERFSGYEYEDEISLADIHPHTQGLYRNVYRHPTGDFIVNHGRIYQVQLIDQTLRLKGTRTRTYKQPVALDEAGHWDTHFAVYGSWFNGGLAGGGGVLGHLADALDPVWPQVIRERLPDWWRDRAFRRHYQLTEAADDLSRQLNGRIPASNATLRNYNDTPASQRPSLLTGVETLCTGDIQLAVRQYQTLVDLLPLTHGNKRRAVLEIQSDAAQLLADRYKLSIFYLNHRMAPLYDRLDDLLEQLDDLPVEALQQHLGIAEQARKTRLELVQHVDRIDALMVDLNRWYELITNRIGKRSLAPEVTEMTTRFSEANLLYLKTGNLIETIDRVDNIKEVSWFFLRQQSYGLRARVDRALYTQHVLSDGIGIEGRNQLLQNCLDLYAQFRREMKIWTTSYPQHFHQDAVEQLMAGVEKMAERARKGIELPGRPVPAGQIRKKVFTTEDGLVLFGVEEWVAATQTRRYRLTGKKGIEEIWEQNSQGKFHLLNAPAPAPTPPPVDLAMLVADARKRLQAQPTYLSKVQDYARQGMLPVDLEHMMVSEADELTRRALRIEAIDAQDAVIATLREKAAELTASGRTLRTRQSLESKKPTDGMLDDLMRQQALEIRKTSPLKNLGKRQDGRADYLQEYEVWDLTPATAKILWYAHFHYNSATPLFRQFEKAHLKLPEHRFLTHADNASLPYADIGKRSVALEHFESI